MEDNFEKMKNAYELLKKAFYAMTYAKTCYDLANEEPKPADVDRICWTGQQKSMIADVYAEKSFKLYEEIQMSSNNKEGS